MKIFNFLSALFGNKDFISQESLISADFENITYYWIKIVNLFHSSSTRQYFTPKKKSWISEQYLYKVIYGYKNSLHNKKLDFNIGL